MFHIQIPVRISDINYGHHLGYDRLISILYQARVKFLQHLGLSEIDIDGVGIIIKHIVVDYQSEAFFDDMLDIKLTFSPEGKCVYADYVVMNNTRVVAKARETILFMSYETRKVSSIPKILLNKIAALVSEPC